MPTQSLLRREQETIVVLVRMGLLTRSHVPALEQVSKLIVTMPTNDHTLYQDNLAVRAWRAWVEVLFYEQVASVRSSLVFPILRIKIYLAFCATTQISRRNHPCCLRIPTWWQSDVTNLFRHLAAILKILKCRNF